MSSSFVLLSASVQAEEYLLNFCTYLQQKTKPGSGFGRRIKTPRLHKAAGRCALPCRTNVQTNKIDQKIMTGHDKLVDNLIADYLKKATPKTIHQMAMEWNWDTSDHFIDFVVDNPNADKATILMIYWMAGPRFSKQFSTNEESKQRSGSDSTFELLEKIESNFQRDFYKSSKFYFDPNSEDHTGTIWAMQDLEIKTVWDIPEIMFQKLDGEVIETNNNFDEGIPPELLEQIEELD